MKIVKLSLTIRCLGLRHAGQVLDCRLNTTSKSELDTKAANQRPFLFAQRSWQTRQVERNLNHPD
ncbi:hypothetical protein ALT785_240155 [Alteromonas infernus]